MKFLDLFAGIGGIRLGMEQAGHECVGWVEWDKFARKSYVAIHKPDGEFTEKDINNVNSQELPKADCWCFGFPCQDISVAGKQGGFTNGKRSSLFFKVTGLIRELKEEDKPSYLFIENVKNLLSINKGWDFAKLQVELDEIGYDVEWSVLDSAEVVPQHRERIFIIGHLRGRRTQQVFPIIRKNGETNKAIKEVARINPNRHSSDANSVIDPSGISHTLSTMQGGGREPKIVVNQLGNISNSKSYGGNPQVGRVYGTDGISPTLSTMQGGGQEPKILDDQGRTKKRLKPLSISPTLRSQSHGNEPKVLVSKYERTDYGKQVRKDYESKKIKLHRSQIRHLTFKESSISNTLTTVQKDNMIAIPVLTPDRIKKRQNGRRFKTNGEPEFTLTGQDRHGVLIRNIKKYAYKVRPNAHPVISITPMGNIRGHKQDYKKTGLSELQFTNPKNASSTVTTSHCPKTWDKNLRIRKLTPLECWRLQGFPDWAFDRAKAAGLSDSQLYKQVGNSVTVPVIKNIAERMAIEW